MWDFPWQLIQKLTGYSPIRTVLESQCRTISFRIVLCPVRCLTEVRTFETQAFWEVWVSQKCSGFVSGGLLRVYVSNSAGFLARSSFHRTGSEFSRHFRVFHAHCSCLQLYLVISQFRAFWRVRHHLASSMHCGYLSIQIK